MNGQSHGHGMTKWACGGRYEGQYFKGLMHGQGNMEWPDGTKEKGWFVQGQKASKEAFDAWENQNSQK